MYTILSATGRRKWERNIFHMAWFWRKQKYVIRFTESLPTAVAVNSITSNPSKLKFL